MVLKPRQRMHFASWEEHITKNFDVETQGRLRCLLDACCETPEGEEFATLRSRLGLSYQSMTERETNDLLTLLVSSGYLEEPSAAAQYKFRSGLVRAYWARYQRG